MLTIPFVFLFRRKIPTDEEIDGAKSTAEIHCDCAGAGAVVVNLPSP